MIGEKEELSEIGNILSSLKINNKGEKKKIANEATAYLNDRYDVPFQNSAEKKAISLGVKDLRFTELGAYDKGKLLFKTSKFEQAKPSINYSGLMNSLGYNNDISLNVGSAMTYKPAAFSGNDEFGKIYINLYGTPTVRSLDMYIARDFRKNVRGFKLSRATTATITNHDMMTTAWGKDALSTRFVEMMHNLCCTYEELAIALVIKEMLCNDLEFTDALIDYLNLPGMETVSGNFKSDNEKWSSLYFNPAKRGLFSTLINLDVYYGLSLILDTNDIQKGSGVEKWYTDFLNGCINQGISVGQVLVALSYMYTGKYEDKNLGTMGGYAGNTRYTIDKNTIKNIVVKGSGGESNTNFIRAYKSFISKGMYKSQLGDDIKNKGPYSFDPTLPYMFYYDKTVPTGKFTGFFTYMLDKQKNIKLCNSIKAMKQLHKTMSAVKPEFVTELKLVQNPKLTEYFMTESSINTNTTYAKGQLVSTMSIKTSIMNNLRESIGKGLGNAVEQKIMSDEKNIKELMNGLGF